MKFIYKKIENFSNAPIRRLFVISFRKISDNTSINTNIMNLGKAYRLQFTIFFCIFFLAIGTFAIKCTSSPDPAKQNIEDAKCAKALGKGTVCSSSGKTVNNCIYACHSDNDCVKSLGSKCDKGVSPHWLCTCDVQNGNADCYETGMGFCNANFDNHCMSDSLNSNDIST
ncbi:unnamed protein product [Rhizophagus irregularis]|nr:unnamed protein product [Rhizophagus irregularis]